MSRLPAPCVTERTDAVLVVSEQGRTLRVRNPRRARIRQVRIDGCGFRGQYT